MIPDLALVTEGSVGQTKTLEDEMEQTALNLWFHLNYHGVVTVHDRDTSAALALAWRWCQRHSGASASVALTLAQRLCHRQRWHLSCDLVVSSYMPMIALCKF